MMSGIGFWLLLGVLARQPSPTVAVVKWEDVLTRVLVDIHGNVYNVSVREVVEADPGEFCRVELVLRHDKGFKPGTIGVDYLHVTCAGAP